MDQKAFPVIDLIATGDNIRRLRTERGMSVRDLQHYFGFEQPQAIYKWQKGACLPSVDNLYALGTLLEVPMDQILVPAASTLHSYIEQQADACCSHSVKERHSLTVEGYSRSIAAGFACLGRREGSRQRFASGSFSAAHVAGKTIVSASRHPSRELCEAFLTSCEQQADACCSSISGYGRVRCGALHFSAARGGDTGPGGGLQVSLLILNSRKEYGDVCAPGRGKGRPRSWRQGGFARGEAGDGERPTLSYITSSAERYCHF